MSALLRDNKNILRIILILILRNKKVSLKIRNVLANFKLKNLQ